MKNLGKNNLVVLPFNFKCTLLIPLVLLLLVALDAYGHLEVKQGSPFKIAIFSDLHFGEDAWTSWGPLQDIHSMHVMSHVLDQEKPDFVVYLGDVITGNNIPIANATSYWDMALSPTREKGIPWATVFGNHDDAHFEWPPEWFSGTGVPPLNCSSARATAASAGEHISPLDCSSARATAAFAGGDCGLMGTTRLQLMDREIDSNMLSSTQKGPRNLWPSVSNYVLNISSSQNNSKSPVAYLYFLDSGGGSYPEVISNAQVKWFNQTSQEINPNSRIPEIVFWHIPSRAYNTVAPSGTIAKPCVGSINKESVAPQRAEYGIMKALEARPSVQAVFVGHNHGLDWCCPHNKLWLCFARHTGYGGYGNWSRGARILEITEQPFSLKSWITMEDGSTHSRVVLSS